ncbi:MAG: RHS repeat-associated core domain-containing protein, partial [Phycisphaeraceae bacterium]|nr:RHS repeat-associated core domain-containing protein [Phycisphaeraceae bacterium]
PTGDGKFNGLDNLGRVIRHQWTLDDGQGVNPVDGYAYGHDASGNRLYRENLVSAAHSELYQHETLGGYDDLNRLRLVLRGELNQAKDNISSLKLAQGFTLDALGNWAQFTSSGDDEPQETVQIRTHDPANQVDGITVNVGSAWIEPSNDDAGNTIVAPDGLDPTEKRHLVYDAWNRLVAVTDGGDPATTIVTYRYNGLHHRVQKILWDDADPQTPDTTIDYYYNADWQVVEERVDGAVHAQYLWCLSYIDTPVLRWRDTTGNEELDETLYYTVDANKNVTALIDAATGNVVERYLYDPYGWVMVVDDGWNTVAWSASRKNEILFAGYRYNPETGYYHVRHREYHPMLGRWMQRDPLGYVDGGNLYEYVRSGPVRYVDPRGLASDEDSNEATDEDNSEDHFSEARAICTSLNSAPGDDWQLDLGPSNVAHFKWITGQHNAGVAQRTHAWQQIPGLVPLQYRSGRDHVTQPKWTVGVIATDTRVASRAIERSHTRGSSDSISVGAKIPVPTVPVLSEINFEYQRTWTRSETHGTRDTLGTRQSESTSKVTHISRQPPSIMAGYEVRAIPVGYRKEIIEHRLERYEVPKFVGTSKVICCITGRTKGEIARYEMRERTRPVEDALLSGWHVFDVVFCKRALPQRTPRAPQRPR